MALEILGQPKAPLVAGADLSASTNQFCFVKPDGVNDFSVILCAAATDVPIGVLQDTPSLGQAATVESIGISKVIAGGTITVGQEVGTDASGHAVPLTPGTDTTKFVVGRALQSAVAGDIFSVFLDCVCPGRAA